MCVDDEWSDGWHGSGAQATFSRRQVWHNARLPAGDSRLPADGARWHAASTAGIPVSYTHLTLPTIYSV